VPLALITHRHQTMAGLSPPIQLGANPEMRVKPRARLTLARMALTRERPESPTLRKQWRGLSRKGPISGPGGMFRASHRAGHVMSLLIDTSLARPPSRAAGRTPAPVQVSSCRWNDDLIRHLSGSDRSSISMLQRLASREERRRSSPPNPLDSQGAWRKALKVEARKLRHPARKPAQSSTTVNTTSARSSFRASGRRLDEGQHRARDVTNMRHFGGPRTLVCQHVPENAYPSSGNTKGLEGDAGRASSISNWAGRLIC